MDNTIISSSCELWSFCSKSTRTDDEVLVFCIRRPAYSPSFCISYLVLCICAFISGILYLQRILALHIDLHDVALIKNTIWNGGSTARSYISLGTGWNGIHTNISPTAPIPRAQGITWKLKFVIMSFDLLGRARLILEEGKVIFLTLIEPFLILV